MDSKILVRDHAGLWYFISKARFSDWMNWRCSGDLNIPVYGTRIRGGPEMLELIDFKLLPITFYDAFYPTFSDSQATSGPT